MSRRDDCFFQRGSDDDALEGGGAAGEPRLVRDTCSWIYGVEREMTWGLGRGHGRAWRLFLVWYY